MHKEDLYHFDSETNDDEIKRRQEIENWQYYEHEKKSHKEDNRQE